MLKLKQRVKTYVAFNSSHFGVIMTIYFRYLSELLFLQTFLALGVLLMTVVEPSLWELLVDLSSKASKVSEMPPV